MANLSEIEAQTILNQYAKRVARRFGTWSPDYPPQKETEDQPSNSTGSRVFSVENDGTIRPYYGSPRQEIARTSRPPQTTNRGGHG
jgi:hypothetical protein